MITAHPIAQVPTRPVIPPSWLAAMAGPRLPSGAACTGRAPLFDVTVPGETTDEQRERLAVAAAVCVECPIRNECSDAVEREVQRPAGVWAGQVRGFQQSREARKRAG